jgi:hypothetical protein
MKERELVRGGITFDAQHIHGTTLPDASVKTSRWVRRYAFQRQYRHRPV